MGKKTEETEKEKVQTSKTEQNEFVKGITKFWEI